MEEPAENAELRALGQELAAAEASPWQPRCLTSAFARLERPFVFTMQTWIDLDFVHSPLLQGELPAGDDVIAQIDDALAAFNEESRTLTPADAIAIARAMLDEINHGFGMMLKMNPTGDTSAAEADGFGSWLPLLACLVSQLGMSLSEARTTPVSEAFPLIAAHRHNQGWSTGGMPYAQRDAVAA